MVEENEWKAALWPASVLFLCGCCGRRGVATVTSCGTGISSSSSSSGSGGSGGSSVLGPQHEAQQRLVSGVCFWRVVVWVAIVREVCAAARSTAKTNQPKNFKASKVVIVLSCLHCLPCLQLCGVRTNRLQSLCR